MLTTLVLSSASAGVASAGSANPRVANAAADGRRTSCPPRRSVGASPRRSIARRLLSDPPGPTNALRKDLDEVLELVGAPALERRDSQCGAVSAVRALGEPEQVGRTVNADNRRVRVQFAGHPEIVTGRQLVLAVAMRTGRTSRGAPKTRGQATAEGTLSNRELEVLRLIAFGYSGPEIAAELHLAHDTVRSHVRNAMRKAGARSRAQLVAKTLGEAVVLR